MTWGQAGDQERAVTRVRVTCSDCGDVVVRAPQVTATVVGEHGGCFAFPCPLCRRREARAAAGRVLEVLVASGAVLQFVPDAASLERQPQTAPMTEADAARAVEMLDDEAWFARELATHITDELVGE
jgi:hypothetical protein